jgi:hypothetical protein
MLNDECSMMKLDGVRQNEFGGVEGERPREPF